MAASQAFVEVDMFHGVSVLRHNGVSELGLQLGHSDGAAKRTHRQRAGSA